MGPQKEHTPTFESALRLARPGSRKAEKITSQALTPTERNIYFGGRKNLFKKNFGGKKLLFIFLTAIFFIFLGWLFFS